MATIVSNDIPPLPPGFVLDGQQPQPTATPQEPLSLADRIAESLAKRQDQQVAAVPSQETPPLPPGFVIDGQAPQQEGFLETAAQAPLKFIEGASQVPIDFAKGFVQGGKEVIGGALQAGADIAGGLFPKSDPVKQFRELIPDAIQRSRQQFEAQKSDTIAEKVGEFAGEVAPFAIAPLAAVTLPAKIGLGAVGGALAGGTRPTTEQLTPGKALEQRAGEAAIGGAIGGTFPVAAKGIGAGLQAAGRGAARVVRGLNADKILTNKLTNPQAREALDKLEGGKIAVLADVAGDEIRGLTRAVAKEKGGARDIVTDALQDRSNNAVNRVINQLSKSVSNAKSYFTNLDDIAKGRAAMAAPLYDKAYKDGVQLKITKRLNTLINDQRIVDAMEKSKSQLGVSAEARRNSIELIDGAKKILDDTIGAAKRAGENERVRAVLKLKNELLKEADRQVPAYAKARKVFSGFKALEDAQGLGFKFSNKRPEEIQRLLVGMSNSEKEAFKIGVRENLQKIVAQTSEGADPAKRIFGNEFKKDQLKTIFDDPKQFADFSKLMKEEIKAAETKFKVLGGSRTDFNLTDDQTFILEAIQQSATQGATVALVKSVGGAIKRRFEGLSPGTSRKLAKILTDREAGIEALNNLLAKAPKKEKEILSGVITNLGTLAGIGVSRN